MMNQKTIAKHGDLEVIEVHISLPLTGARGRKWWKLIRGEGLPFRRCGTRKEAMEFFDVLCLTQEVFPSCVLTDGPLEGERVLGMWILDRIGPVRYSFKFKAERAVRHFKAHHPNHKATVLEENRTVKGRKPGPVFFVGIEGSK